MPETRAAKRRKLEGSERKGRKRKEGKKKESTKKPQKKQKTEAPTGCLDEDETLKAFDLNPKFGACIGISRLDRWKRARRFRLAPPEIVKQILDKYDVSHLKNRCLWEDRV